MEEYFYNKEQAMSVVLNCPKSCGLCINEVMEIEIIDVKSGEAPVLLTGSTFTGDGTFYNSPSSDFVSEQICVDAPICLIFKMKPPKRASISLQTQLETRVTLVVTDMDKINMVINKVSSFDSGEYCISDCPANNPFDPSRGICKPCLTGQYADSTTNTCQPCKSGTYSDVFGSVDECAACPSHIPFSHPGSNTLENCITLGNNLYAVSKMIALRNIMLTQTPILL